MNKRKATLWFVLFYFVLFVCLKITKKFWSIKKFHITGNIPPSGMYATKELSQPAFVHGCMFVLSTNTSIRPLHYAFQWDYGKVFGNRNACYFYWHSDVFHIWFLLSLLRYAIFYSKLHIWINVDFTCSKGKFTQFMKHQKRLVEFSSRYWE